MHPAAVSLTTKGATAPDEGEILMTRMNVWMWGFTLAATATCGCGQGLVDDAYEGEAITTLHGTLTAGSSAPPSGPVSLTILWMPAISPSGGAGGGSGRRQTCSGAPGAIANEVRLRETFGWVSQSVTFQPQFPISFQIPVTTLPPLSARQDLAEFGGQGTWSFDVLVAYLDGNNNGVYDLAVPGNAPDQLLAASSNYSGSDLAAVFYLDSTDLAGLGADFGVLPQGFSVLRRTPTSSSTVLPVTTSIELTMGHNIQGEDFSYTGCRQVEHRIELNGARAANAQVECRDDKRYYWWHTPVDRPELCVEIHREGSACVTTDAPIPAGWPCD